MHQRTVKAILVAGIMAAPLTMLPAQASTLTTNADWTWMKGSDGVGHVGLYGTLGTAASANTPGARIDAISWTDVTGVLWLFGGNGYGNDSSGASELNDLWKYDPVTTNWTWMKGANVRNAAGTYGTRGTAASANTPGAREAAGSWVDGAGALWLFGGYGYDSVTNHGYLNDLWSFDPVTTNWTWIKGSNVSGQRGTYGTQGTAATANTPGARYGSVSWVDGAGALWLFGGYGVDSSVNYGNLNDLWKFDPATTNWTWIKGSDITNQAGTYGVRGTAAPANTPGARIDAISWTDVTGALWLFGGDGLDVSGTTGSLNDLWKYDPAKTNWTWLKGADTNNQSGTYGTRGTPSPANTPGARFGAVSWVDGVGALWLFGGHGRDVSGNVEDLNDLWKFDPATTNWTWIKGTNVVGQIGTYGMQGVPAPGNKPGKRQYAVSWTGNTGALWLFGGYGYGAAASDGYLNDLWKFDTFGGISLDTQALGFSATVQGANPAAQMIGMINAGGSAFTYTNVITYSAGGSGWLTVLPSAGTVAPDGTVVLTNQVNIAGLAAGTYYATNRVTADATNSPQTVVVTLTVNAVPSPDLPPSAPTSVSACDGAYTDKVRVTWNVSSGATSYEVWRNTSDNSGTASKISGPDPIGTSYEDTSVAAHTTYYYWVKAVNGAGASAFSASDSGFSGVVGPLITANGLVGDVYLGSGAAVTIAVQMMNVEQYLGVEVDWWVVAFAHSGEWYYLDDAMQWQSFSGDLAQCHPVYPGPLFHLPAAPVLREFTLPSGTYNFWFAVDYPMDGILNLDGPILFDCVTVIVQ